MAMRLILSCTLGLSLCWTAWTPTLARASSPGAVDLEEVTVTALRRPQALLTHAGSIARIDAVEISELAATHHSELMNRAPGVLIQRGSGQESLTALRSPVLTGAGSCGAFLFLEDGLPIRPVGFCNVNELFEVNAEQASAVEIIRGPGSALYGSNAVHGIVNVINPTPAELPPLALGLEVGSDDYFRARLAASAPVALGEVGMVMHGTHDGGWRDASGFEEGKLAAAWAFDTTGGSWLLRLNATRLDQETAGFIQGQDSYRDPAIARSNANPEAYRQASSLRATATHQRELQDGDQLDLRLALRSSHMDFLQHFLLGKPLEENGQDSLAVFASRSRDLDTLRWVVGLDAELASGELRQSQDGPTTGGPPAANAARPSGRHYDYVVDSRLLAAYAQAEWALGDSLTLTTGLRWESLAYDYDNRMIDGNTDEFGTPCPGSGCLYSRPADRRDSFSNLGPRLGLSWQVSDSTALWAGASRGYRPPEATELYRLQRGQQVADLDSEFIEGLEAGIRHRSERLRVELTGYRMRKDDIILRDAQGFNITGGRTSHEGIEYGLGWSLGDRWSLLASGTLARHRYEFTGGIEQGEQVTRGDDVDTAPRQLHVLRLGYAGEALRGELEWLVVGDYWTNAANTNRYPGHEVANLRLHWQQVGPFRLSLRVTNLFDRAYADRADFAFGNARYFPGRGRAAFLEIGWQARESSP